MKQPNRWVYAIVGVIVLLFAGLVYAWSVLSTPIAAEFTGWTKAQLSLTFTLVMILFCIGSLLCGLLAGKLSAKNAVRLGAVLFLAGFYIASRCQAPLTLYLGFGVLCGLGSGLSYNAVMSTMVKWFPDKPGLISGVLLMGFGGGSFLIGKLYQAWTPAGIGGWRTSFVVLGIVCFAVLAVCSFFFVAPGADFAAPAGKGGKAAVRSAAADIKPVEMLKKPTFWLYYVWAIAVSAAGLGDGQGAGPDVEQEGGVAAGVAPGLSGVDTELLDSLKQNHKVVVVLEDGSKEGGFGGRVAQVVSPIAIIRKLFLMKFCTMPTEIMKMMNLMNNQILLLL